MEKFLGSFAEPDPVVIETAGEVDSVAPVIANDDDDIEFEFDEYDAYTLPDQDHLDFDGFTS